MKGRLAIVISESGIESITIMSSNEEARQYGRSLCEFLESEITEFEQAIKMKMNNIDKLKNIATQ